MAVGIVLAFARVQIRSVDRTPLERGIPKWMDDVLAKARELPEMMAVSGRGKVDRNLGACDPLSDCCGQVRVWQLGSSLLLPSIVTGRISSPTKLSRTDSYTIFPSRRFRSTR